MLKIITLMSFTLILCSNIQTSGSFDVARVWREFKQKFNKSYGSEYLESFHREVFADNFIHVTRHNLQVNNNFSVGINSLSDLATDEILDTRCGLRLMDDELAEESSSPPIDIILETLMLALNASVYRGFNASQISKEKLEGIIGPAELDWRTKGRVSRVKDQGSCGSCWAFATTGALEGLMAAEGGPILLSEQNLIDCSGGKYKNKGCIGGLMGPALAYVRDYGIMSARDYPYSGGPAQCKFRRSRSIISVSGSALLPVANEELLRLALAIFGPLPAAIDSSLKSFHNYRSGVYDDPNCKQFVNHAVLLVGYGNDPKAGPFWLVKNSWGLDWGNRGYIKIARNRGNLCGIASYAVLPIPRFY